MMVGGRFYFDENNDRPRCVLCGIPYGLEYCSTCGEYFCPRCENKWGLRAQAMLVRASRRLNERFA